MKVTIKQAFDYIDKHHFEQIRDSEFIIEEIMDRFDIKQSKAFDLYIGIISKYEKDGIL